MAKIKLSLCGILWLSCLFAGVVFGSGSSESGSALKSESEDSQNATSNLRSVVNSELSLVLQRLEAQELRIQELEKSGEECKSLKMFYQKSHEELKKQFRSSKKSCDEQFKTLRKEVDQLKSENCVGEDVWLLTPPIRGRRGQKGEKGDSGLNGNPGQNGGQGERGVTGPKGDRGEKGERGQVGPKGQRGDKGEKGDSGVIATTPGEKPGPKGQVKIQIPTTRPTAAGPKGTSTTTPAPPSKPKSVASCSDALEILPSPRSQKQSIYPHGNTTKVEVLCDFETDGGGWTIIQKRTSGPKEEFKRNWSNYTQGFGSVDGNFWLGLENIRALTKNGDQELKIQLEDFEGEKKYAKYSSFSVSDASDSYRLTIGGFSGDSTLKDSMFYNNGYKFTTIDKNNDAWSGNCAADYRGGGGWWFDNCRDSNLNGLYFEKGETVPFRQGIWWVSWKGYYSSLAKSEMKIRKRKP